MSEISQNALPLTRDFDYIPSSNVHTEVSTVDNIHRLCNNPDNLSRCSSPLI